MLKSTNTPIETKLCPRYFMKNALRPHIFILFAIVLGAITGLFQINFLIQTAEVFSKLFTNFLQLIVSPIVFLSIFSTLVQMKSLHEMKSLGKRIFFYTVFTTVIAALLALLLYLFIDPAKTHIQNDLSESISPSGSYLSFFINIVPSNFVQAFLENNVIGIAFLSFFFGAAALTLPKEHKDPIQKISQSLFQLILKVVQYITFILPFGIWAFVTLFIGEIDQTKEQLYSLSLYLMVVLGANLLQGFVILPLLLKFKKISPLQTAKKSAKPLLMAFFSKSSNAALPLSIQAAEENLQVKSKIARFSLPLCTVINMNGCAAFILTTVLFVSNLNGLSFSPLELGAWVFIATIAAIGNAGVPMGCFFLSSAFLVAMGVPLNVMGMILPFYALIDMVETALNVWSDISVTAIVDRDLKEEALVTS